MEKIIVIVLAVTFLILFFGLLIILYALAYQKRKNKHAKEKQEMETHFQEAIMQTKLEIQEHTLKNVAQEIHDNIGQALILAKINLNTFPINTDPAANTKILDTKHLVSKAIKDLRDLSKTLHGDKITDLGLQESIQNEIRIIENTGLYKTSISISGSKYLLPPQTEIVLFRIVQESIHNAIKHSNAKSLTIALLYEPLAFTMSIADDGKGFNESVLNNVETGIGLKNMRDRAALVGGKLSIHSAAGNGATISVTIDNPAN